MVQKHVGWICCSMSTMKLWVFVDAMKKWNSLSRGIASKRRVWLLIWYSHDWNIGEKSAVRLDLREKGEWNIMYTLQNTSLISIIVMYLI